MKKGTILYGIVCFALGAAICGGTAAYAAGVMAERSTNTFYVDGEQVELPAYLIGGSNYVMLRDVGQVVGFNVYWNEEDRTVQIESDRPYTGVAPEEQVIDDASIANPAIFTDAYTREAFNAIRQAIVTGRDSTPIPMSPETRDAMRSVITEIGDWTVYHLESDGNGNYHFTSIHPTAYEAAAKYCEPFISSLSGLTDKEKVRQIAFYVCDRLTYKAGVSPTPSTVLVSDSVKSGNCMAYAFNFQFLCDMAGIPCVYVQSSTHQWNEVYVDGQWWSVDVSGVDVGNDPSVRPYQAVLYDPSEMQGSTYKIEDGDRITFAKEILVPGSTK